MFAAHAAAGLVVLAACSAAAADTRILAASPAPTPQPSQSDSAQFVDYGDAGWCFGGGDEFAGTPRSAAACWSLCVGLFDAKDVVAVDWWPDGYGNGQAKTCFCQSACLCAAEGGAGNTLLLATAFAALTGLPRACHFANDDSASPSPTVITDELAEGYRRALFIGAGLSALLICAIFLTKCNPDGNADGNGSNHESTPEAAAARATAAAEAQAAAARALAARLAAAPSSTFASALALAADPAAVDATCAICLVDMEKADVVKRLGACHHCYHADCLDEWLRRSELCPLCKTSVLPPPGSPALAATSPPQPPLNLRPSLGLTIDAAAGLQPGVPLPPPTPRGTGLRRPRPLSSSSSSSQASSSPRWDPAAATRPPPLASQRSRSPSQPRHSGGGGSSRASRGTSLDSTVEMVAHSPPPRPRPPPQDLRPAATARGRAVGGATVPATAALAESAARGGRSGSPEGQRRTARRQPSRSALQQHRRAVAAATAAVGRR